MLCRCHCSNVLGFGAAAIAMGIFLRSLDTLLFNNEDRRVARAEQERMKMAVIEVTLTRLHQDDPSAASPLHRVRPSVCGALS